MLAPFNNEIAIPLIRIASSSQNRWKTIKIIGETLIILFCHASQLNILKIFNHIHKKIHQEKVLPYNITQVQNNRELQVLGKSSVQNRSEWAKLHSIIKYPHISIQVRLIISFHE